MYHIMSVTVPSGILVQSFEQRLHTHGCNVSLCVYLYVCVSVLKKEGLEESQLQIHMHRRSTTSLRYYSFPICNITLVMLIRCFFSMEGARERK